MVLDDELRVYVRCCPVTELNVQPVRHVGGMLNVKLNLQLDKMRKI